MDLNLNLNAIKTETKKLLDEFYQINTNELPSKRIKSEWESENKRGFFLGIIEFGQQDHIIQLHNLLISDQFQKQQEFSTLVQLANPNYDKTYLDTMFAFYIEPFHNSFNDTWSCHTPTFFDLESRDESVMEENKALEERKWTHCDLKRALVKRDKVCLFCWDIGHSKAAHIVAQKNHTFPFDESVFNHVGLTHKHQIQNGLLLCISCYCRFEELSAYVDVVDDQLVFKLVNFSNIASSKEYKDWRKKLGRIYDCRYCEMEDWTSIDNRQAKEENGEMALHFVINDSDFLPNKKALEYHKTACLIWRMAGGDVPDEECCSLEDDYCGYAPVHYKCKGIEQWQNSSSTVEIDSNSK